MVKKQLKSKILVLFMAVAMLMTMMPSIAFATTDVNNMNIYFTVTDISGRVVENNQWDGFQLDKDCANGLVRLSMEVPVGTSAKDAIKLAHEKYHANGPEGYLESGGSFTKIWGNTTFNIGYFVNGKMVMDTTAPLAENDDLELTVYKDYNSDIYTRFAEQEITMPAKSNKEIQLLSNVIATPDWSGGMMAGELANKPFEGATILASEEVSLNIPTSETNFVTDVNGKTNISFDTPGTYYISCKKEGSSLIPAVTKVVVTEEETEENKKASIASDKEALTYERIKGQNGNINSVTDNLDLIKSGDSGKTSISYSSSDTSVIDNGGKVVRPINSVGNKNVTITATISYGGFSDTKTLNITVKALPPDSEVLETVISELPTSIIAKEWKADNSAKEDTNIIEKVKTLVNNINSAVSVENTCVPSAEQTQISTDGAITYGDKGVSEKDVTFTLKLGNTTKEYKVPVTVSAKAATKEEAFQASWLTEDSIKNKNESLGVVKTDLLLPAEDSEDYCTEVEWTSSNNEVIEISDSKTNDNYNAKVRRPIDGKDATVTLSAKIKPGSFWAYGMAPAGPIPEPGYGTKTFTVKVPAVTAEEAQAAQTLVNEGVKLYNLDNITLRGTEDKADLQALTYSINDIPFNWNYVDDMEGFKENYRSADVTWSTTNPGFKDGKIDTGATVIRTENDQIGKIILTISYNGKTATKEWDTKILAFNKEAVDEENEILNQISDALTFDTIKNENSSANSVNKDLKKYASAKIEGDNVIFGTSKNYINPGVNITWKSDNNAVITDSLKVIAPNKDTVIKLTATLSSSRFSEMPGMKNITKDIYVTVVGNTYELAVLQDNIAKNYATKDASWWKNNGKFWHAVGMGEYKRQYPNTTSIINEECKQAFVNKSINDIIKEEGASKKANNLANAINGLSALGYDAGDLYTLTGVKIDAAEKLKSISIEDAKKEWYSTIAPYVVQALLQGEFNSTTQEKEHINYLISELVKANWSWGVDTPMMIVQGLAPYYNQTEVKTAVDKALETLQTKQTENGSFGSSNGDAMAIIALVQLGINPDTDSHFIKNGKSVLDGLLTYKTENNDGFGFKNNGYNEMGTYQGFIALNAALNLTRNEKAYNPFNFSELEKVSARATSDSTEVNPPTTPDTEKKINVTFKLQNIDKTWISSETFQVKEGSKVYHVFTKALREKGFSNDGAESNYVKSITHPNGTKVGEFSDRYGNANTKKNSGWLYKVNGELPLLGICEKALEDGDYVEFYFTEDYTKDPDAGIIGGGGGGALPPEEKPEEKPETKPEGDKVTSTVETESKTDSTGKAEATVKEDAVKDSLKDALDAAKKAETEGKKDVKPVVEVKVNADKNAKQVETKLPANAIKEVAKDSKAELKVSTPVGDINLDNKALKEIAKNAGTGEVKLSVAKPDTSKMPAAQKKEVEKIAAGRPVLELAVTAGTKKISSFGGGSVTVSVPYTVAKGENAANLVVYFVDDNGKATPMETSYDAKTGKINFKTGHFSTYVVGYKEGATKEEQIKAVKDLDLRLTSTASKGRIKITWKGGNYKVVDGYEVHKSTKKFSGFGVKPYFKTTNEKKTTYTNTKGLKKGTRYFYKVRAYKYVDGKKIYSDWSTKAYRIAK